MADTVNAAGTGSGSGLVLDDSDIGAYCEFFEKTSQKADLQLDRLIQTLNSAAGSAFIEGKTAEALREYISRLETLQGTILEFGSTCKGLIEEFHERIKEIDELY